MRREVNGTAAKAHASYTAGKYEEALSHLSQLAIAAATSSDNKTTTPSDAGQQDAANPNSSTDLTGDFRTQHNRALCEHARDGFADPAALEQALHVVRVQLRGKARGNDGQEEIEDEAAEESGSRATGKQRIIGSSGGAAVAAAGLGDLDADASVLLFNLSALHFQQKQYGAAQAVLEHLFLHIEPVDESLAIHICFLLLDVLCHSARGNLHTEPNLRRFAQQSAAVVGFLERSGGVSLFGGDSGGADDGGNGTGGSGGSSAALAGVSGEQTEFAFRLHLYKAKVFLLLEQAKTSKKEIKSALEIFQRKLRGVTDAGAGNGSGGGGSGGGSGVAGGGVAQQGTFSPVPPAGVQNMAALYLKANLEHLRDNHRKALKLLASCHGFQGAEEYSGPGEAVGPPYFNNMGCLHHKLRRHHVALHYFQKALEALGRASKGNSKENGTPAGAVGAGQQGKSDKVSGRAAVAAAAAAGGDRPGADGHVSPAPTCEVLYNTGLQLLLTENPQEALRCFERAALLFHNRPRLWLRMAECGIADHRLRNSKPGVKRPAGSSNRPSNLSGNFAPSSTTRRTPTATTNGEADGGKGTDGNTDDVGAGGGPGVRGPLPWSTVGKGQYRRVLLPTSSSTGGVNSAQGDGAPGPGGGGAIPPLDDDGGVVEMNGSAAVGAEGSSVAKNKSEVVGGIRGEVRALGKRRGDRCSLAHASRCLHNVMYLCAARAKSARKAATAGATTLLGGQASALGVSPRLVAKNLAASNSPAQQQQQHQASSQGSNNASAGGGGDGGEGAIGGNKLGPADGTGEEICQVALVDLAYVHLGMNDPVSALGYAGRVLAAPNVSQVNQHLAHTYAAEALCVLGRPAEALEHLSPLSDKTSTAAAAASASAWATNRKPSSGLLPLVLGAVPATPGGGGMAAGKAGTSAAVGDGVSTGGIADGGALSPEAAAEARASLHANLAAVHALQDNLVLAERCVRTAMGLCPGSVAVLRMAVYVLIRQGNVSEALQVLKEGRLSRK